MSTRALALACGLALSSGAPAVSAADRGADGRFDTRRSSHFVLHQDVDLDRRSGWHGSVRFERAVLAVLESAHDRLDRLLGLRPKRPVTVVVYDPQVFEREFAPWLRFPAAGFYHGVIRVRGATQVTVGLERTLHHELVHAALHQAAPSYAFPAWLNEGLAEWFEARALGKRHPSGAELAILGEAWRRGRWLSLAQLSGPSFVNLDPDRAGLAYLASYAFVAHLADRHGERRLGELCDALLRTRRLERSVARVFGDDLEALEQGFLATLPGTRG